MMPTSPSPSLKFRTVGFPQYGFKASMSDTACRPSALVKPMPGIPGALPRLRVPFAGFGHHVTSGSESRSAGASARRRARGHPSLPQGSLAPGRGLLSPPLIAYYDPIRQSRGHATTSRQGRLYAAPSLCGHASATRETFPTFTAALSARAIDHTPVGPRNPSRYPALRGARLPRVVSESPPTTAVSASNTRRGVQFRRCIVRFMLRPARLLRPPDWLRDRWNHVCSTCPFRGLCHSRFWHRSSPTGAGNQARWGEREISPSSGLAPDKSQQLVRLQHNSRLITHDSNRHGTEQDSILVSGPTTV